MKHFYCVFIVDLMKTASAALLIGICGIGIACAAPGAHGPGGEHLDAPGTPVVTSGLARLPDGSVNVPKSAQRRLAIRTVMAREAEAPVTIELSGRVITDPNASGRVQSIHGGRIEPGPKGMPLVGRPVRKGEVLAYVRHQSDPFARATQQTQLSELQALRKVAVQRVKRLEGLEGTVPRKEIEAARIEATSLAERERAISASLSAREALIAPIDGVLSSADISIGQLVEARAVLFQLISPNRMLVEATTADPTLASRLDRATLHETPDVTLQLIGASRAMRDGVLPLIFSAIAGKSGDRVPLAIGQPVTVIAQSRDRISGIRLPTQVIARNPSNEPIVWIKSGAERFIPQPVQFRSLDAKSIVVTQGLSAENRVVVQGAALIAQIR